MQVFISPYGALHSIHPHTSREVTDINRVYVRTATGKILSKNVLKACSCPQIPSTGDEMRNNDISCVRKMKADERQVEESRNRSSQHSEPACSRTNFCFFFSLHSQPLVLPLPELTDRRDTRRSQKCVSNLGIFSSVRQGKSPKVRDQIWQSHVIV